MSLRSWIKYKSDFIGRISTWQRFAREVRGSGQPMLQALPNFSNPVFVAGCQRSGTTAVSRILTLSEGFTDFWSRDDEELDAAMILSGRESIEPKGRYCFQTTYLNETYSEYFDHIGKFQLVWVVRNPYSVIYSMVYNWENFALAELYEACAESTDTPYNPELRVSKNLWMACRAYNGKMRQLYAIAEKLSANQLYVLNYENMVFDAGKELSRLYSFIGHPFHKSYSNKIKPDSMNKSAKLTADERSFIDVQCLDLYNDIRDQYCSK